MVGKERQHKQELQQATSQITTLKQIHMDNLKISKTKEKEMTALRRELEATQNKMAELGIERDVPEDTAQLEEAIAMSKTAEATAESDQAPIAPKARPVEPPAPVEAPAAKATPAPPPPLGFQLRPEGEPMDVVEDPDPDNMDWVCLM